MSGCYHAIPGPGKQASRPSTTVAPLVELVRSNDLVHLSWAQAMLGAEGIPCLLADSHVSAVEGMIGVFPRRLLVAAEDAARARRLLADAAQAVVDDEPPGP